jgi:hypothetical protein
MQRAWRQWRAAASVNHANANTKIKKQKQLPPILIKTISPDVPRTLSHSQTRARPTPSQREPGGSGSDGCRGRGGTPRQSGLFVRNDCCSTRKSISLKIFDFANFFFFSRELNFDLSLCFFGMYLSKIG